MLILGYVKVRIAPQGQDTGNIGHKKGLEIGEKYHLPPPFIIVVERRKGVSVVEN